MKKWELQNKTKIDSEKFEYSNLVNILLENRGIKIKKEIEEFLNPTLENLTAENLGINKKDLDKSLVRIKKAIKNKEQIIIFGDYDVDGITGTAILWESLNSLKANVMPYIPHRIEEGYGLSIKGIDLVLEKYPDAKIIITVDNGIVANEAVEYANSKDLEVIITDHHAPGESLPRAFAIVHSTKICGSAVGWFLSKQITIYQLPITNEFIIKNFKLKFDNDEHLSLVALATVADVMKLNEFNRSLLVFGLKQLHVTKRPGLIELLKLSQIDQEKIGVYEIGHIIAPRLNAMGRIEHAMDSLRFLCTTNLPRAKELANKLHMTNKDRQELTFDSLIHAKNTVGESKNKLIIISDKSYQPGVIGLISGRLTEEFYRPSMVISEGEEFSKGSARSVHGFNIIEFIRQFSDLLIDKGGHPMAAGFTLKTKDLGVFKKRVEEKAEKEIDKDILIRSLKIDLEFPLGLVGWKLFEEIFKLEPFGYGNPEPTFLSKDIEITEMKFVGKESKHLKLKFQIPNSNSQIEGILFGYDKSLDLKIGDTVSIVYSVSVNEWNGNKKLELKIRDIRNDYSSRLTLIGSS